MIAYRWGYANKENGPLVIKSYIAVLTNTSREVEFKRKHYNLKPYNLCTLVSKVKWRNWVKTCTVLSGAAMSDCLPDYNEVS